MVNQSKPYMTEKEKEIFNLITKEKLTLKEIREKRNVQDKQFIKLLKDYEGKVSFLNIIGSLKLIHFLLLI